MKTHFKTLIAASAVTIVALGTSASANAGVHISIGVGVPADYYGPGYYPPGPCDAYNYYYTGDCGYAVYDGPIYLDGVLVTGPHYYRWYNGAPVFWYRGGWHSWNGWRAVQGYRWNYGEGWGWHGGRWDRDWGRAHWRDLNQDRRGYRHDRRDYHQDMRDLRYDRNHGANGGELRKDRRDIRQDKHELRDDRRDIHHDRYR